MLLFLQHCLRPTAWLMLVSLALIAAPDPSFAAEPSLKLEASTVAISPNGDGAADGTEIHIQTAVATSVQVIVSGPTGATVRQLWNDRFDTLQGELSWDGLDGRGRVVADGRYLVHARTADAHQAVAVRVDTKALRRVARMPRVRHRDDARIFALPLALSEAAMIEVRLRDGSTRDVSGFLQPRGRSSLTLRSSDRWLNKRRSGSYRVLLSVTDDAGNESSFEVPVQVESREQHYVPIESSGMVLPAWLRPIMVRATHAAQVPEGWASSAALYQLLLHESSFNPTAKNPTSTAYGLFQFLDFTWAGVGGRWTSDPYLQSVYGLKYIKRRYRTPERAWAFWQSHRWY